MSNFTWVSLEHFRAWLTTQVKKRRKIEAATEATTDLREVWSPEIAAAALEKLAEEVKTRSPGIAREALALRQIIKPNH